MADFGCRRCQFAGQLRTRTERRHVVRIAVIAVLDHRWHLGVTGHHAASCPVTADASAPHRCVDGLPDRRCVPSTIAPKPLVYGLISSPLGVVSIASTGGRSCVGIQSTGTTHSGWSLRSGTDRHVGGDRYARLDECLGGSDAGQQQQMRRSDCPGGQHDPVGRQLDGAVVPLARPLRLRVLCSKRILVTRVLAMRVRFGRSSAGIR